MGISAIGVIIMKENRNALHVIKKTAIIVFCVITVTMNMVNYLKGDDYKGLGTVYQWSQEAEIGGLREENAAGDNNCADEEMIAETGDYPQVDLNSADSEELQSLSGIGPSKASAIIEYREKYGAFVALEEIMEVPGIGEGIFAKIKDYICIE